MKKITLRVWYVALHDFDGTDIMEVVYTDSIDQARKIVSQHVTGGISTPDGIRIQ